MGAGEFQADLDGESGKAVVEHRPQAVGAGQGGAGIGLPAFMEGDAGHHNMHDRAHRVVAHRRLWAR